MRLRESDMQTLRAMGVNPDALDEKDRLIKALKAERDRGERHLQAAENACQFHQCNTRFWKNLAFGMMCCVAGCLIGVICLLIGGAR